MAAPLDQAPAWVHDLLGSEREEAAADAEQAGLLERMRAGEPGIAVNFEEEVVPVPVEVEVAVPA